MTKTKAPAPVREWQVVDTLGIDPPRLSWFKQNARHVADTLNTRDPGRYRVKHIGSES